MTTLEKTVVEVTCDSCDAPATLDLEPQQWASLDDAIADLTSYGHDWEYSAATGRWACNTCRAVEACHSAGGHVWGIWRTALDETSTRFRVCIRNFDFGMCPGYQGRGIETAPLKEGIL